MFLFCMPVHLIDLVKRNVFIIKNNKGVINVFLKYYVKSLFLKIKG